MVVKRMRLGNKMRAAWNISHTGPKQNPQRLRTKSAKAQKKIAKGSKKDRQRLRKNRRRLNNFFFEPFAKKFQACLDSDLSLSQFQFKPSRILFWACLNFDLSLRGFWFKLVTNLIQACLATIVGVHILKNMTQKCQTFVPLLKKESPYIFNYAGDFFTLPRHPKGIRISGLGSMTKPLGQLVHVLIDCFLRHPARHHPARHFDKSMAHVSSADKLAFRASDTSSLS